MNEIIQRVIEKTGLPEDKAASAVEAAVGFIKERLPGPVASQLDSVVGGGGTGDSGGASGMGGIASGIGGMFGNKQ
ncbi:MAG TPA: hypothetical protein VEC01_04990 [Noviherbaspirillum sp.]|uniref:hypothetical protein n=1 Tax=Noviherbaspirillum sp. TaxID=1926288 RepID=UPI002D2A5D37|nr:hypothetical protein [Noviherbaspirillum sp.]HYD94660.1 hypothetical protein [Noviherbaspirillum sp.]